MTPQHPSQHDDFDNPSGDAEELDQALEDDLWFLPGCRVWFLISIEAVS